MGKIVLLNGANGGGVTFKIVCRCFTEILSLTPEEGMGLQSKGRGRKRNRTDMDILNGVKTILQSDVKRN